MAEVVLSSLQMVGYNARKSPYYRDGYALACEVGQVEDYVDLCRERARSPAWGGPAAAAHIAEMVLGYTAYFDPPAPIVSTVSACPAAAHHAALTLVRRHRGARR